MPLSSINMLHLRVSDIQPGQAFLPQSAGQSPTMGENNTHTVLKGHDTWTRH